MWSLTFGSSAAAKSKPANKPHAETSGQEVERLAAEAVEAYKGGAYDKSVALLTRAYAIHPLAPLLYNLAKAYNKQNDVDNACATYKKYTEAADTDPKLLEKAREKVASCDAAKKAMMAPPVDAQEAEPEVTPPTPEEIAAKEEAEREKKKRIFLISGIAVSAVGVACLGTGVGLWASARSQHDDFQASFDEEQKRSLRDSAQARGNASIAMYAVGALLVAGSAPLYYFALRPEKEAGSESGKEPGKEPDKEKEAEPETPPVTIVPWLGPGAAGGMVTWRF